MDARIMMGGRQRRQWFFDGCLNVLEYETRMLEEVGYEHDADFLVSLEDISKTFRSLVDDGFIIQYGEGIHAEYCWSDTGDEFIAEEPSYSHLIDYSGKDHRGDAQTESEVEFIRWGFAHLLENGVAYDYLAHRTLGEYLEIIHVLNCGVNGDESIKPRLSSWEVFDGTYFPPANESVFEAFIDCRCGEVVQLRVGDPNLNSPAKILAAKKD